MDNLIATIDVDGQQIDGSTEQLLSQGSLRDKWEAFGWDVMEMNGNKMGEVISTLEEAKAWAFISRPVAILIPTNMGHGAAPNDEQLSFALTELTSTLSDY